LSGCSCWRRSRWEHWPRRFVIAQAFNLVWTLMVAWLIFGGVLFTPPAF